MRVHPSLHVAEKPIRLEITPQLNVSEMLHMLLCCKDYGPWSPVARSARFWTRRADCPPGGRCQGKGQRVVTRLSWSHSKRRIQ